MGWGFLQKKPQAKTDNSTGTLLSYQNTTPTTQKTTKTETPKTKSMSVWMLDMSKAYNYKLYIEGLNKNKYMTLKDKSTFLPVESMSISPVSVESTSLQIGIFSDLPLMTRRKIGRLRVTMLDTDDNAYEKAVIDWFDSCVPSTTGYVAYMDQIIREATYVEYNNQGKATAKYRFYVMPDGEIASSRGYEGNELKKFEFNMLIVSEVKYV